MADAAASLDAHKALVHFFFAQRATKKVRGVTDVPGISPRPMKVVAVLGGGLMGSGICTACLLNGIDVVLNKKDGCARFELPEDRMGDIIVVSGGPKGSKVLGTSRDKHDLSGLNEPLRSHGGLTEQEIPVIANRKFKNLPATLRNFDAFALGCNHIVEN